MSVVFVSLTEHRVRSNRERRPSSGHTPGEGGGAAIRIERETDEAAA